MVKEVASKVPLHCAGNGDNFAAAVCFLASEEAGFVTGEVLNLSGGIHVG
jgi:3-oxoacyl-[acyl-carrier protein] reductase